MAKKKDRIKPGGYIKLNGVVVRSMKHPVVDGKVFVVTDDGVILIVNTRTGVVTTAVGAAEIDVDSMDEASQYAMRLVLTEQTERLAVLSQSMKFLSAVANVMKYASQPVADAIGIPEVVSMLHPEKEDNEDNPLS